MNELKITLFVALGAVAVAGCTKSPIAQSTAPETAGAAPSDALDRFKACWASFNAKDEAAHAACYDDDSAWAMVDVEPPMAGSGRDAARASFTAVWTAFPDLRSNPQLVLRNGNRFASILLTQGTNAAEFMGMPATNKPISILETQVVTLSDAGTIQDGLFLTDHVVMMHQLGIAPNPRASDGETDWPEAQWVTATDSEAERANVNLVKTMLASIVGGDREAYLATVSNDISFRYIGDKTPMNGMESFTQGFNMWMDMAAHQVTPVETWGAGDWVVAVNDNVHTLNADFAGVAGTKGKQVKTRTIEFLRFANGKLEVHWVFENSMAYAVQLGMLGQRPPS